MAASPFHSAAPWRACGFGFQVLRTSGDARRGVLRTPHGDIDTPTFMPVGTRASVKGVSPGQLAATGTQIVLANTYHLMLRPGPGIVAELGGLHRFMGWDGPILTDSGGFQVFSLASLRSIDDDGVSFQSHIDGAAHRLGPEESIQIQNQLGADIIMAFDECPPLPCDEATMAAALERTIRWARRSLDAHQRDDQALYGIVQGGLNCDARLRCVEALTEIGFDGYSIGGLSVGEPPPEMWALLRDFAPQMPADRPRYLMGVGTPRDLVEAVRAGVDQFDCVMPTRNGRKGYAFTSTGVLRMRNAAHRTSDAPLDPACECETCARFSRGYIRHLITVDEPLGATLVSVHNLWFYQNLMAQMRRALDEGEFGSWADACLQSPVCQSPGDA